LCSNSTGDYVLGFRPALPLTGGESSDPGGYVRGVCPPTAQSICTGTTVTESYSHKQQQQQHAEEQSHWQ